MPLGVATINGEVVSPERGSAGMSEYQYYEFLALDQLLTMEQRAELRSPGQRTVHESVRLGQCRPGADAPYGRSGGHDVLPGA
jgi:hypothetical protein